MNSINRNNLKTFLQFNYETNPEVFHRKEKKFANKNSLQNRISFALSVSFSSLFFLTNTKLRNQAKHWNNCSDIEIAIKTNCCDSNWETKRKKIYYKIGFVASQIFCVFISHAKSSQKVEEKKKTIQYLHWSNRHIHVEMIQHNLFIWIFCFSIIFVATTNFDSSHFDFTLIDTSWMQKTRREQTQKIQMKSLLIDSWNNKHNYSFAK